MSYCRRRGLSYLYLRRSTESYPDRRQEDYKRRKRTIFVQCPIRPILISSLSEVKSSPPYRPGTYVPALLDARSANLW